MNYKKGNISVIIAFVVVIVIIGLVVFALMKGVKNPKEPVFVPQTTDTPKENSQEVNNNKNQSMNTNNDRVSKNGDTLSMNYTGRLEDGTVFDSNVDPRFGHVQPFEFQLGAGQVIKGWDEGLVGMKIGEKKTLTIPPEKGYGSTGAGDSIPPNATLIFDVEVLGIK